MLTSRGQENLVHARSAAGKALLPKTPSNFQTPRNANRAPLGAKTTNAKAQTIFRDKDDGKRHVFKTPAPEQRKVLPDRSANGTSVSRRSARSKITVAPTISPNAEVQNTELEDEEPDFGYAPPPPIDLPDPPIQFNYDQTFPQFRPENMFRGYGEIYHASPKDENGLSIRLKREQKEYREYQEQQEEAFMKKIKEELSKPLILSDDEFEVVKSRAVESKPDTVKARLAASALSSFNIPSVANKQTASSRLKMNQPVRSKPPARITHTGISSRAKPVSTSKNTIGFPKAKRPPSIIPEVNDTFPGDEDALTFADEFSDFEFFPCTLDDEDIFQLPVPE